MALELSPEGHHCWLDGSQMQLLYSPVSPALQPALYPVHWEPPDLTGGQPLQKVAVRDSVKSLIKIQKSYIKHLPFIDQEYGRILNLLNRTFPL